MLLLCIPVRILPTGENIINFEFHEDESSLLFSTNVQDPKGVCCWRHVLNICDESAHPSDWTRSVVSFPNPRKSVRNWTRLPPIYGN